MSSIPISSCSRVALLLAVPVGALPTSFRNIENDAIGILEFALEITVPFVAEIEEELAAVGFDPLLRFGDVVDLKAEMVSADKTFRILEVRGLASRAGREIEQGEIDHAVAHVNG